MEPTAIAAAVIDPQEENDWHDSSALKYAWKFAAAKDNVKIIDPELATVPYKSNNITFWRPVDDEVEANGPAKTTKPRQSVIEAIEKIEIIAKCPNLR